MKRFAKFAIVVGMKLYSTGQVIRRVCAGVVATGAVFGAVLFFERVHSDSGGSVTKDNSQQDAVLQEDAIPAVMPTVPNATQVSNMGYTQDEAQNIAVYDMCNAAVVNITTQAMGLNWFLEPIVSDSGSGSGSIIDKRGYVLTNVHVIKNADKIYVSLSDGTQYEASVTGVDEDSDLAVIKFDAPAGTVLQTISFGDSDKLKVGQKVIAIGNPFGFDRTMTQGIVSALGRPIKNGSNRIIRNMIQTDTAINPGNSGGPLLDTSGRMIGINTMIYSSSGASAGIGFAVPSSTAARVVNDLLKYGKVHRGKIDANLVQLNASVAKYAGLGIKRGMLVSQILDGGEADSAGLRGGDQPVRYGSSIIYLGGDVITKIDNIATNTIADYYSALESKRAGDSVTLTVYRNGRSIDLKVVLVGE